MWRLKLRVLELLFASFQRRHLAASTERRRRSALSGGDGRGARAACLFDALHEHALRTGGAGPGDWPESLRHPDSPKVAAFAREHRDRVDFFAYLQWLADQQLAAAHGAPARRHAAWPVQDIAVGVSPASAMAWANPGVSPERRQRRRTARLVQSARAELGAGAALAGRPARGCYAVFAATLRHNMRHAGAVRLDHVMGLQRLFWIPEGAAPAEGAYVRYPFADLARIIALESERHRCLVIGEDLGTVPRGFRPAMQRAGMMSCRVLYFERAQDGAFAPPEAYPRQALGSVSTHDLPTLRGFWTSRDLKWRELLGRFPDEAALSSARSRARARPVLLLHALQRAGCCRPGIDPQQPPDELSDELALAVHRYLAATPGHLVMVQLEDALGEEEQPNLPGTVEHANWRRKLGRLEELADEPMVGNCRSDGGSRTQLRGQVAMAPPIVPRATYRLQFHKDFGFDDAMRADRAVPRRARREPSVRLAAHHGAPGSTHGYDVIDFNRLNPELGDEAAFEALIAELHAHDMGLLLDFVPNHMGVGSDNPWWLDVLEWGRSALTPLLRHRLGRARAACGGSPCRCSAISTARCSRRASSTAVRCRRGYLPRRLLRRALSHRGAQLSAAAALDRQPAGSQRRPLFELADRFAALFAEDAGPAQWAVRRQEAFALKAALAEAARDPVVREALDAAVAAQNGTPGLPETFQALHALLEDQAYRLAYWRVASSKSTTGAFSTSTSWPACAWSRARCSRRPIACCCA